MSLESSRAAVIDEAIELFERSWRVDHRGLIEEIVSESQLSGDPELLAELIRVDIDRRYAVGAELSVGDYFSIRSMLRRFVSRIFVSVVRVVVRVLQVAGRVLRELSRRAGIRNCCHRLRWLAAVRFRVSFRQRLRF
jgi:hypothetical protein